MEQININIIPNGTMPICHVSQYDVGRVVRLNLFEGVSVYTLAGTETIELDVKKPDGNIVTASVTNNGGTYVEIVTTEQMTACSGANLCELRITDGDTVIGTLDFVMACEKSPLEGGVESESEIHDLQSQVDQAMALAFNELIDDIPEEASGKPNYYEGYYVSRTGELVEDADFCASELIPCKGLFTDCVFYYGTNVALKVNLVAFKADRTFLDFWGGTSTEMRSISGLGSDVAFVQFSYPKTYLSPRLTSSRGRVYWKPNLTSIIKNSVLGNHPTLIDNDNMGNMGANSTAILENNSIKRQTIIFYCKFSAFSGFSIGHGSSGATYTEWVKVDGTNLTVYTAGSAGGPVAHGLTMSEYIALVLDVKENCDWSITIHTLGGSYTRSFTYPNAWLGYKESIFVKNEGTTITSYRFTFVGPHQRNKWLFGDSYLSNYSPARWPYYLHQNGYDFTLINAFPGENSEEAYLDWRSAMLHGNPKFAIWCLGMNDPDTANDPNESWLSNIQKFIADCEKRGVTPILATIPNVPNILHTHKNAWVKASGYRYIDFAEAVGAEAANSTWYDGCLETSSPRIHPTENGARLLYLRALTDFPEFMQD